MKVSLYSIEALQNTQYYLMMNIIKTLTKRTNPNIKLYTPWRYKKHALSEKLLLLGKRNFLSDNFQILSDTFSHQVTKLLLSALVKTWILNRRDIVISPRNSPLIRIYYFSCYLDLMHYSLLVYRDRTKKNRALQKTCF